MSKKVLPDSKLPECGGCSKPIGIFTIQVDGKLFHNVECYGKYVQDLEKRFEGTRRFEAENK